MKSLKDRMRERMMTCLPSFFQPMTMLLGPMRSETSSRLRVAVSVSRLGVPPSVGIR